MATDIDSLLFIPSEPSPDYGVPFSFDGMTTVLVVHQEPPPREAPKRSRLPAGISARLVEREAAAEFLGIGVSLLDDQVRKGILPEPIRFGGRKLYDLNAINKRLDQLGGISESQPGDDDEGGRWNVQ
jgi:hypothetical protein